MSNSTSIQLPEGVRQGDDRLIAISKDAAEKIESLILREQKGEFLRVKVTGGGCSGLAYKMKFVESPKRGDILIQAHGVNLIVDSKSALYLRGMTMDYSNKLVAGGFKFSNPNAKATCSCGESFAV